MPRRGEPKPQVRSTDPKPMPTQMKVRGKLDGRRRTFRVESMNADKRRRAVIEGNHGRRSPHLRRTLGTARRRFHVAGASGDSRCSVQSSR